MKRIILILMLFGPVMAYAQGEISNDFLIVTSDSTSEFPKTIFKRRVVVPAKALIFNAGYGVPFIHNDLMKSELWTKNIGSAAHFEVDFRKQFQKERTEDGEIIKVPTLWAVGMGLDISYYSRSAYFMDDSVHVSLPGLNDADGDIFEAQLDYKKIKESVSLLYLSVPLYVEIGKLNQVKTSFFVKMGVKASLLISDTFSGEGTYSSNGYYNDPGDGRAWNIGLYDIPELNFYTNEPCYNNPEYKASPFVLWGTLAGGVNIPFSSLEKNRVSNFVLRIGAKAEYSLTKVSKSTAESYFIDAPYQINRVNMLGGNGSRILAIGLEIGIVYCL